jgi:hypothetical protein
MKMGIKLYNHLPNTIREVKKMRQFKRELRLYLLQNTFYSVDQAWERPAREIIWSGPA